MLIVALILAVIGLAALIAAVVTSNELIAWVCIGASGFGILLLIIDAIRERTYRRAVLPAGVEATEITEVVEPVEVTEVVEPVEVTEVIEPVEVTEVVEPVEVAEIVEPVEVAEVVEPAEVTEIVYEDEIPSSTDYFAHDTEYVAAATELSPEVVVEDHPEELVYSEPDYDTPSDDEPEFPAPAEEAAIHVVGDLGEDRGDYFYVASSEEISGASESAEIAEDLPAEVVEEVAVTAAADDPYAAEVFYTPSPEGSADTVYTYSESAEIEYINAEGSEAADERRDH